MLLKLESGVMMSHLRLDVVPLSKDVLRLHLSVPAFSIFTHAVTPLENSTSLHDVLFAEAIEIAHQKIPIRLMLSKSFFMVIE